MSAVPAKVSLEALLERFGGAVRRLGDSPSQGASSSPGPRLGQALPTGLAPLDHALAEGGLPLGVSVLASPRGVGGASELASRTLAQLQAARPCLAAWVDPSRSLFAPGLARRGVDLTRLVVVRPSLENRAMAALELVTSGAFAAVVVDQDDPWGAAGEGPWEAGSSVAERALEPEARAALRRALAQEERFVRRLLEASKRSGTAVLLLTDSLRRRSAPLPASVRLACTMPSLHTLEVHLEHDRRGAPPARVRVPLSLGPGVARAERELRLAAAR
jgi:hypothetical protein